MMCKRYGVPENVSQLQLVFHRKKIAEKYENPLLKINKGTCQKKHQKNVCQSPQNREILKVNKSDK